MSILVTVEEKRLLLLTENEEHNNVIDKLKKDIKYIKDCYMESDVPFNVDKEVKKLNKQINKHAKCIKKNALKLKSLDKGVH